MNNNFQILKNYLLFVIATHLHNGEHEVQFPLPWFDQFGVVSNSDPNDPTIIYDWSEEAIRLLALEYGFRYKVIRNGKHQIKDGYVRIKIPKKSFAKIKKAIDAAMYQQSCCREKSQFFV